jgi:hypothetical protein
MKSSTPKNYATGFGFVVVHGFSFRGFTLTVRPRAAWASGFGSFLLFRRLRAIG